jgi:adenylate cyclase
MTDPSIHDHSARKPAENLDALDLYYRAIESFRRMTNEGNKDALRLARKAISLDPNFAAAYSVALACFTQRKDQGWAANDEIPEGKQFAQRVTEVGRDDAFALSRAAHFLAFISKEVDAADAIVDQAIAVNPNLADAWRIRGYVSAFLGRQSSCDLHNVNSAEPATAWRG